MKLRFCPIASGSSGNSVYIGTEHTHILVDAGISGKKLAQGLKDIQVEACKIDALFITHEHRDHIKGAGILSRRFNIPIYATCGTWDTMKNEIGAIPPQNVRYIYAGENCIINDIQVLPFEIPHDASQPVGYSFFTEKHKVTVATDIGHITNKIQENVSDCDALLLESNHDVQMLKMGSYPWLLKKRILGEKGHISNETAGNLLSEIMTSKLKYVYLGHLSEENNIPHLAYETVETILRKNNIKVGSYLKLDLAARYSPSRVVEL